MKTFQCNCGARVFFENNHCLSCGSPLAWCPSCQAIEAIQLGEDDGGCRCVGCGIDLVLCHNYRVESVCNRAISQNLSQPDSNPLCDYCRFNDTIPDLAVEGHRELWYRLEKAKRRLLYTLDLLKLPYGTKGEGFEPPLSFDFKGDVIKPSRWWWRMGKEERVYTGHADGKITINIKEADEIHRVQARVSFDEAHRTEIGHFRHEMGHYYWQMLVTGPWIASCIEIFGDHDNPSYSEALQSHYESGPPDNWRDNYISAYATMHPWEDFAETFATYLDMVSVLDTAMNMEIGDSVDPATADLETMIDKFIHLGVVLNEMNRAQGLIDLVPEILTPAVTTKLSFVHDLLRSARADQV